MLRILFIAAPAVLLLAACGDDDGGATDLPTDTALDVQISSPAFAAGAPIPVEHTCDGADGSPSLTWTGVPANAGSLALVMDDVDVRFTHWVVYGITPDVTGLPAALPQGETLPNGAVQGVNDFGEQGYGGPCPPSDTHTYRFRLYVLDEPPRIGAGATGEQLLDVITGHVMGWGELTGTYRR
jgi:Raf kinase inhibitor-like YbhB/YbcL family protein